MEASESDLVHLSETSSRYEKYAAWRYSSAYTCFKALKHRLQDDSLCLGVIGSFSSGKSTLINSMLEQTLLLSDTRQGTTKTLCIIRKSPTNDIEIAYENGRVKRLTSEPEYFLQRYIIGGSSSGSKLDSLMNLLGRNRNDLVMELFARIQTSEKFAEDVKYIILYSTDSRIPGEIDIADTPGTDTQNLRHDSVSAEAVNGSCDVIAMTIPCKITEAQKKFIDENLKDRAGDIIFILTKVENVPNLKKELARLKNYITRKLQRDLGIAEPMVLVVPSLLKLRTSEGSAESSSVLRNIPEDIKPELLETYAESISQIKALVEGRKQKIISDRIYSLCRNIHDDLQKYAALEPDPYTDSSITHIPLAPDECLNKIYADISKFFRRGDLSTP